MVPSSDQCNERRRVKSALPAGGKNTIWKLGNRQSSFHGIARALRNQSYNALGLQPLYRHAIVPLCYRFNVGRLAQELSPSSSRLSRVSYAALRGALKGFAVHRSAAGNLPGAFLTLFRRSVNILPNIFSLSV